MVTTISKKLLLAAVLPAIALSAIVAVLLTSQVESQGEIEASAINKDKPYWDADRPKTGQVNILALEISSQSTYKEVKYGKLPWLDAAVDNAGQNTAVDDVKLKEFFKYTEDGNTDFKVVFNDNSEKFYRLYFMEVP